ncbi:MAG: hypothetical protein H9847_04795 [Candidatus Anaerobiospirillum pullicola]|uniref:Uncharacterized protein n=1 Tax=Candidatus Anaerobiospirillum pullicola TaxID=2838451 RepID=A0A948TFW8_9GAMM|nr:hypothetical protein [Candidatus Anaerobiospirillum pullicola]
MSHLTPDQVQDLIDHMSDEDIDFLSDLLLNTVIDAVACVEFDSAQLKQTIVRYLNQVRYDLSTIVRPKDEALWAEFGGDELEPLLDADAEAETEAEAEAKAESSTTNAAENATATAAEALEPQQVQLQLDLLSTVSAGSRAGEGKIVASLLVTLQAPFSQLTEQSVRALNILWLPDISPEI